jgi:hypothetical protein
MTYTDTDTSTAPSPPVIDTEDEDLDNVVFVPAFAGDTVSFGETLNAGAAGIYTTTWSCDNELESGGDGGSGSVTLLPGDAGDDPVVCTITNTRKTATLRLSKSWGTSPTGVDEVDLDLGSDGSIASATSALDGSPNGTASATVLVGSTYSFDESFDVGSAATTFYVDVRWGRCRQHSRYQRFGSGGTVAVTAPMPVARCRVSSSIERKSMTLKLQKSGSTATWANRTAVDRRYQRRERHLRPRRRRSDRSSTPATIVTVTAFVGRP